MSDTNGEKQKRLRSAHGSSLPIASVIDDPETFKQAVKLLKEATAVAVKQSELEDRERAIREELSAICQAYGLKGLRHGLNGFEYHGYQTRKTLSKERLLALGVAADVIEQAYSEGNPFLYSKIVPFDIE